jgi:NDP-sugar pyrophosphorylase family protein
MEKKVNIVLPIAGLGQRFIDGGYETPKPLIKLWDNNYIIERALKSVDYKDCNLFFIVRQEHIDEFNIDKILKEKFGNDIHITAIDYTTEGALCTCLLVEEHIDNDEPLVIFTPDCYFEPKFYPNNIDKKYDGMVVTFNSDSPAHSYVVLDDNGYVTNATEKEVISNNAVGGLYYYRRGSGFVKYSHQLIDDDDRTKNEFYICPVFNYLIKDGGKIGIEKNTKHLILGTPEDLRRYTNG